MKKKLLILLPYPLHVAPSQRYRIEHFLPYLKEIDVEYECHSFLDENTWNILYQEGAFLKKGVGYLRGLVRRKRLLKRMDAFDGVWIHREVAPLLANTFVKQLRNNVDQIPIFFEFDDAVWMENYSEGNSRWRFLKSYQSALEIMKLSTLNIAGNAWLGAFCKNINPSCEVIPTVVNTEKGHHLNQDQTTTQPRIGWTGTHSTIKYLERHFPILEKVYEQVPFELVVISDIPPKASFPGMRFIEWNKDTEAQDLLQMHIGIMPLPDETWVKGKCGFKLIQYMALGIVPVADAIGENTQIIQHKKNGLLCEDEASWINHLLILLTQHEERKRFADNCRPAILENYSVLSQRDKFLHLLETNLDLNVNN